MKRARAINTKLDAHTLRGSRSACIDPEVKISKVKVTLLGKMSSYMAATGCCGRVLLLLLPALNCTSYDCLGF